MKRNQPNLYYQVKHPPWGTVPISDEVHTRGHGRYEIRRLQVLTVAPAIGLEFPHVVQAIRVRRRRMNLATGRWSTVTVYAVINFTAELAHQPSWPTGCAGTGASRCSTTCGR